MIYMFTFICIQNYFKYGNVNFFYFLNKERVIRLRYVLFNLEKRGDDLIMFKYGLYI